MKLSRLSYCTKHTPAAYFQTRRLLTYATLMRSAETSSEYLLERESEVLPLGWVA